MRNITVGIVDYGFGNHASVVNSLRNIGFRTRVSYDPIVLDAVDVLLIPGVGAFPLAMEALLKPSCSPPPLSGNTHFIFQWTF